MLFLRINGVTSAERNGVISEMSEAISKSGSFIVDHYLYSDLSVCLVFQTQIDKIQVLWESLCSLPIRYSEESHTAVDTMVARSRDTMVARNRIEKEEVMGTLEVTFSSGTGDLRRIVPAVPG